MSDQNDDPNLPTTDQPLHGKKRSTTGPLIVSLLVVAGIIALFFAITAFVSDEREPPRRADSAELVRVLTTVS
jgi:hypothetical protein